VLGVIRLRGWQVHQLAPVPADLAGRAAYLVRVNYEFDIATDAQPPTWAEVEFEFPDPEVVVYDAVPTQVVTQAGAASYELTGQLNFVRRDGGEGGAWPAGSPAANIALPALVPRIESFGLGGSLIKWRHTGDVPPGTHTGWLVLLVPEPWEEVPVVAAGNYHVETDPGLRLRPEVQQDAFTVSLPKAEPAGAPGQVAVPAQVDSGGGSRVFVSYAHESAAHTAAVTELCGFLSAKGMDVHFDRQGLRSWDKWIITEIRRADYVIVIASPAYRAAADGTLASVEWRSVLFEYQRLVDLLHRYRKEWTRKILPVVLPGRSPEEIPLSFLPGIADHYVVTSITDEGTASLLRILLHQAPA
jgi:TIR domain